MKIVYRSRIGWWVWGAVIFSAGVIFLCGIGTSWVFTAIYGTCIIGLEIVSFLGVWYTIEGDTLTVYNLFRPLRLPIDKISEIKYCHGCIAGPALSLRRLAIKFKDRSVLKSFMPIEISPKDRDVFVAHLLRINPDIKVIR